MRVDQMLTASEMEAATTHVGLADHSDRVRLEIAGPDRAKFLHNLTTNEVKRLAVGRGCEAFVTSPQGKTIGYLIILVADDKLIAGRTLEVMCSYCLFSEVRRVRRCLDR